VSYNVKEIENEIFDAKTLYKKTIQTEIVKNYKKKEQIKQENN
jgi:hypothetical protein